MDAIQNMHVNIEQSEFEKLWKKFDTENYGFVKGELFMRRLGVFDESKNDREPLNDESFNDDMTIDDSASEMGNNIPYANVNGSMQAYFTTNNDNNKHIYKT